jgi:hypothetical protein
MALDVLISYAFADKRAADAACAALEAARIRCWIAPRNVLPGVDNADAIIEAIDMSHSMLLIFSSNANRSEQVKRGVERAISMGIEPSATRHSGTLKKQSVTIVLRSK